MAQASERIGLRWNIRYASGRDVAGVVVVGGYRSGKQIVAPALNALIGDHKTVFEASYALAQEEIRRLVKRAVQKRRFTEGCRPKRLLRAVVDVANVASSPDWQPSATRLVDMLIAGSRLLK